MRSLCISLLLGLALLATGAALAAPAPTDPATEIPNTHYLTSPTRAARPKPAGANIPLFRDLNAAGWMSDTTTAAQAKVVAAGKGAVAPLTAELTNKRWEVRALAARLLGQIGDAAATPALSTLLADDPDMNARHAAAVSLGQLKAGGPALRAAVQTDLEADVRAAAVAALARAEGAAALPFLRQTLQANLAQPDAPDPDIARCAAVIEADKFIKDDRPGLLPKLYLETTRTRRQVVRFEAIKALGTLGIGQDMAALQQIMQAPHPDADTKYMAARSLADRGDANALDWIITTSGGTFASWGCLEAPLLVEAALGPQQMAALGLTPGPDFRGPLQDFNNDKRREDAWTALQNAWKAGRDKVTLQPGSIARVTAGLAPAPTLPVTIRAGHPRLLITPDDVPGLRDRCLQGQFSALYDRLLRELHNMPAAWPGWQANPDVDGWRMDMMALLYLVENRDRAILARSKHYADRMRDTATWGNAHFTGNNILRGLCKVYDWSYQELSHEERMRLTHTMLHLIDRPMLRYLRFTKYSNQLPLHQGAALFPGITLFGDGMVDARAADYIKLGGPDVLYTMHGSSNECAGIGGGWPEDYGHLAFFGPCFAYQYEAWRVATGEDLWKTSNFWKTLPLFLTYSTRPDGRMPELGWHKAPPAAFPGGMAGTIRNIFPLLTARYGDSYARDLREQVPDGYTTDFWPTLQWYNPQLPRADWTKLPTVRYLDGMGWVCMRSAWNKDATYSLFISCPYFTGHQRTHANTFILHKQGELAIQAQNEGEGAIGGRNTLYIGREPVAYRMNTAQPKPMGRIVAYETNPHYTYSAGEASEAYNVQIRNQPKVKQFTRHYLYFPPNAFLVLDQVWTDSPLETRWRLHSRKPAQLGPDGFVVDAPDGEGRLFCKTLLPAGPGAVQITQQALPRDLKDNCIEVTPAQPEGERQLLLHFLYAGTKAQQAAVPARCTRDGDNVQVAFTADGKRYDVTFTAGAGPFAGRVKVTDAAGKLLRDQELTKQIAPAP